MKKVKRVGKRGQKITKLQKIVVLSGVLVLPLILIVLQQRQDIRQRAAAVDPTTGSVQPVGQTGNWQLIFSDEFSGTSLDSSKWIPCYPYWDGQGCNHGDAELQWYQPQNITFSGGIMNLIGKKESKQASNGKTYEYTAGMVSSAGKFTETYYYMEMRAKSPKGKGYWPAFWTLPADETWPPEIDVMEILGHEPNVAHTTYHWIDGGHQEKGQANTGADLSADYHVYAADWRADAIIWYIDGKEVYRYTDVSKITNKPMYMLVNLAIGGQWPGNPDTSTTFPQNFDIDYVRAWKPGTGANPSINPSVVPSVPYVCLGPCPTLPPGVTSPINPTQGTVQPTGGQTIPSTVPSIADPCVSTATSIAHRGKSKHHRNNGGGLMEMLLNFFKEIFALLEKLFGGGNVKLPDNPTPIEQPIPEPSATPC